MSWMFWLDDYTRKALKDRIDNTLLTELVSRHWGTVAPGKSQGDVKRYYITDFRALNLVAGTMRYTLKDSNTRVFYRGQDKEWILKPSLYRNVHTKLDRTEAHSWIESILDCIKDHFDPRGTTDEREALAQHYGLHSRWLDIVDHIQTALWFAYDNLRSKEDKSQYDDDVGYIYLIAVPYDKNLAEVIDLRTKPSLWLRPHIQQAFAFRTANPGKELGDLSNYNILTLIIPKTLLKLWSNYENIPHSYYFPSEAQDSGLRYWNRSKEIVRCAGLDIGKF